MPTSENEVWRRLHPAMLVFGAGQILRQSVVPIIFALYVASGENLFAWLIFMAFSLIATSVGLVFRWRGYRYQLADGHIVIHEGIFSRKLRSIPVRRIHNLNTSQSVAARLFRVVRLDIETAGGGAAEASFFALSLREAERIQDFVRREKQLDSQAAENEAEAQVEPEIEERPLYKIGVRDILMLGATTNRMGVIFVGLAVAFQYFQEFEPNAIPILFDKITPSLNSLGEAGPWTLLAYALSAFALMFFVAWILSIATALIRWYGFTLSEHGSDLHIRTGLLTLRRFTIPLNKIQALECRISAIRRPLSRVQIKVLSAGHVGFQDQRRAEFDLLAPITRHRRIAEFVRAVWQDADWEAVRWHGVDVFTRTRQFRILAAFITLILTLIYFLNGGFEGFQIIVALLVFIGYPAAWGISHLTYKQTAYGDDGRFIYIKTGFLGMHYWVVPISKVQTAAVWQSPFQRRRGLASLAVDTAGSSEHEAVIPNIPTATAWLLFNRYCHPAVAPSVGPEPNPLPAT